MASGRSRTVVGSFIGTGATLAVAKIGFTPRSLRLFNQDDPAFGEYVEGMADDAVATQKAGTSAFATSGGVTLTAAGFSIGNHASLNVDGERTWFVASE